MLEIRLFGTPIVTYDGQLLDIQRRTVRALLYHLAAIGKPVGREQLATFFWPDSSEREARANLRDILGKLRNELPNPDNFQASRQSVQLLMKDVFVDVLAFQNGYDEISHITWTLPPDVALPAGIYTKMTEIIELWNRPGFISGVDMYVSREYEDWMLQTEIELERKYLETIQRLNNHERASGNLHLAIRWLTKALDHKPDHVDINLLLIKTYLENGQRLEAQKRFEYLQQAWDKNDAELPEEIASFKDVIFSQMDAAPTNHNRKWLIHPSINVPYVGQEHIFKKIESAYRRGGMVLMFGEAGAGKTRLAREVYSKVSPRPRLFLTACFVHKADVPFHPWSELLRKYVTDEEWRKLGVSEASLLAMLIPEIANLRSDLQPPPDRISARIRQNLFDAIYQVLQLISGGYQVLLFIDDMQWADQPSCDLVVYLANHSFFRQPNSLFLMAVRKEEKKQTVERLSLAFSHGNLEQVYLDPLQPFQTAELASHIFKSKLPEVFPEKLTRITGGNPYFILEALREMYISQEEVNFQEGFDIPISNSVFEIIRQRIQRLSMDGQMVVSVAALQGNHFNVKVAERACQINEDRFLDAIDELQESLLITEVHGSKFIQYEFVHENIRETLLADMPSLKAKRLHGNIARAMVEIMYGKVEEIASVLAKHFEIAGEYSLAFDYWIQGATYAFHATSINEALQAFKSAKQLIAVHRDITDEQINNLYSSWSEIHFNLDEPSKIQELNHELLSLGKERESDFLIGVALKGMSDAYLTSNQFEKGLDFTLQAEPYLNRSNNMYEVLQNQKRKGICLFMLGKLSEAYQVLSQIIEQIPEDSSPEYALLRSNIQYQIGTVDTLMGYPKRGLEHLEHALKQKQTNSSLVEFNALMGLTYYLYGDYDNGYRVTAKAIEIAEQIDYWRMLGYAYAYSALNTHYMGRLDIAWEHAEKAFEIGKKHEHFEISALACRTMGHIYLRLRNIQKALDYFQTGIQLAGNHFSALEIMTLQGYTMVVAGQVDEGLKTMQNAYETSSKMGLGSISTYAHCMLLFTQGTYLETDSTFLEKVELALLDAKKRPLPRISAILNAPFVRVSQRPEDYINQLTETLQSFKELHDPIFEIQVLQYIIEFKKKHELEYITEQTQLYSIIDELTPYTQEMPFAESWNKYCDELRTL